MHSSVRCSGSLTCPLGFCTHSFSESLPPPSFLALLLLLSLQLRYQFLQRTFPDPQFEILPRNLYSPYHGTCVFPELGFCFLVDNKLLEGKLYSYVTIIICSGCCNKIPLIGWFEQQKLISSQFWMLKSEIKVSAGLISSVASPCLVDGCHLPVSSHGSSTVCEPVYGQSPLLIRTPIILP